MYILKVFEGGRECESIRNLSYAQVEALKSVLDRSNVFYRVFESAQHSVQRTDCPRCVGKGYFMIGSDECKCPNCDGTGISR